MSAKWEKIDEDKSEGVKFTHPKSNGGVFGELGDINGKLAEERQKGGGLHLAGEGHQEVRHCLTLPLCQDLLARKSK